MPFDLEVQLDKIKEEIAIEDEDLDDVSCQTENTMIDRPFLDAISEDSDFYEISVSPKNEWILPKTITLKVESEKFTEALSNIFGMLSKGRTTHSIKGMVFKVMKIGKLDKNPAKRISAFNLQFCIDFYINKLTLVILLASFLVFLIFGRL